MLSYQDRKLVLDLPEFGKPLSVDFIKTASLSKNSLIAKAVGLHKLNQAQIRRCLVYDISAGLGQDAYSLYQLGCQVKMVERSEIMAKLLQDGLNRAGITDLELYSGDAKMYLQDMLKNQREIPDVIYFDPMFPEKKKTALAQKSARVLKHIVGEDKDSEEVFLLALKTAKNRVVVKRGLYSPAIISTDILKPDVVYKGKAVRFDVYLLECRKLV